MKTHINIGFLFDLDGVIIDSEREYDKIWIKINREYPTGIENLQKIIKGCTLSKILNDYYPQEDIQRKVSARLRRLEDEMKYDYLGGAEVFLQNLNKRMLPTAMVTSSNTDKMRHLLSQIPDILDYFKVVITGDLVTNSKPHPEGYLLAARKLGLEPQNCVVFEDSLQGVMAGKASGAFVVGIYGTLEVEKIAPYSDMVVGDLEEIDLENLIEKVRSR